MPEASVGSLAWAKQSRGAITRAQALAIAAGGVRAQLHMAGDLLRRAFRLTPKRARRIDIDAIKIPDSAAARRSLQHASELLTPAVLNHCLRSFVWGAMRAQMDELSYDAEFFFVACALHDLGVSAAHHGADASCSCFAVEGAEAAHAFGEQLGWAPARRDELADAIARHINLRVEPSEGAEAHLLHEGAGMDVAGLAAGSYGRKNIAAVIERHPRLGLNDEFIATMRKEAKLRPKSRTALMLKLGYVAVIRSAPFRE